MDVLYSTTGATQDKLPETADQGTDAAFPSTLPHEVRVFFFGAHLGPITVLGLIASLVYRRLAIITPSHPISACDYGAILLTVLFWCFQEHFIHGRLLYSQFDWFGKEIHRAHHEEPYFHISIDPLGLLVGWMAAAYLLLLCLLPSEALATSATIGYAAAGMWYEWTHYLVHTRVTPRSRFGRNMRDGHRKHHLVDNMYWLGFTVPFVDDLFGTNPSVREAKKGMVGGRRRMRSGTGGRGG